MRENTTCSLTHLSITRGDISASTTLFRSEHNIVELREERVQDYCYSVYVHRFLPSDGTNDRYL